MFRQLYKAFFFPALMVALMWAVALIQTVGHLDFGQYGIIPRTRQGLLGILMAPFIHADYNHLFSNSIPLLITGTIMFYYYRSIAWETFFWVYLQSGLFIWIIGPDSSHIGASALIYGFVSFILLSGVFRRNLKLLLLSVVVMLAYGGLVQGLFPGNPNVSWLGHLFGAFSGACCAWFYRGINPNEPVRQA